jgi:polyhydroxybutyrate depolymerase
MTLLRYKRGCLWSLLGFSAFSALVLVLFSAWTGRADGTIMSGGERRAYLLHVPASYDPAKPVPLVISIHGFAEWPAHLRDISRWNDLADRHGFIVAYPAGTGFPRRWRATGAASGGNQDVTFIADLLDQLAARYSVDLGRIYINGFSNGGGITYLLTCQLADRIAAAGSVAGAYSLPSDACQPARAVPFIAFHGTADPIVPYAGGTSGQFHLPVVPDWIAGWAERSGCNPTPTPLPASGPVSGLRHTGCQDGAEVVFYSIEGGGHAWPGSTPLPRFIVGHTPQEPDATEVMWAFFSRHRLAR